MAALMTAALGTDPHIETRLSVVDLDGGPAAAAFVDEALGHPEVADMVTIDHVDSERAVHQALEGGEADAGIILPPGLSAALGESAGRSPDGEATTGPVVLRSDENPFSGDLAKLLIDQFAVRAHATVTAANAAPGGGDISEAEWPLQVEVGAPDGAPLNGATAVGPPIALFFVLATLGFAAQSLVADRDRGILERLAAAPLPRSALLTGRAVAGGLVGGLSMTTLVISLQLIYGQDWGPLVPLTAVIALAVAAMVGIAALVAALARTPGQAQTLSVGVAFVFLLASGTFSGGGGNRASFAELVPNSHAFDGFALLATEGAGLADIGGSLAALAAFAAGGLVLAALVARRLV
jgi:ABC-2 type transport system permease protein